MIEVSEPTVEKEMSFFSDIENMNHEQVVFCHDKELGLKAIIAIHNTILGPAMGGTRMWQYASDQEALTDVLRLSRGMTLKNSIAGLNIGGGKSVIIGNARKLKNEAFLRRFGKFINSLGGKYWTAEDVNMSIRDMQYIHMETPYVTGLPEYMGGSGDPSSVTAYGVYMGIKAGSKKAFGSESLEGKKILVQGAGQVGTYLIKYLAKEKTRIYVSDIFDEKLKYVSDKYGAKIVHKDKIYELDVDIYSPCALGASLNDDTIPQLKCAVVAGGANNQLLNEEKHGKMLIEKGIIYIPDFLINSGGIINVYYEFLGNYNKDQIMIQIERIYNTALEVIEYATKLGITPQAAAIDIAKKRIAAIGRNKLFL